MTLEKSILNAMDLTGRMKAALEDDNIDLCQDLLEIRGYAMKDYETTHRASSSQEKASCKGLIEELISVDRALQSQYQAVLEVSAVDFRKSLSSRSGTTATAYNTTESPACVDRKA